MGQRLVLSYGRQSISPDDIVAVVQALKSPFLTQGPLVERFERALCAYTGAKYAVVVSNGTAALHLSMLALGIGSGDEVVVPPITFLATANCALFVGAKPVFSDVEAKTACLDVSLLEKAITDKTRCIIPVHFAGQPCDMKAIRRLADKHGLFVVEDAAHAIGSIYEGDKVGSCRYSDITVFSFHPVKNMTTGEGGAIMTNNAQLYKKLLMLRAHGATKDPAMLTQEAPGPWYYEMKSLGYNYRLTDIQCALGISQLKKLNRFVKKRKQLVSRYRDFFKNDKRVTFLGKYPDEGIAWHIFPALIDFDSLNLDKKEFFARLYKKNIIAQVHYIPVHLQPYYRENFGFKWGDFPVSENYYKRTVTLPLYPGLSQNDVVAVGKAVQKALEGA